MAEIKIEILGSHCLRNEIERQNEEIELDHREVDKGERVQKL